MAQKCTHQIFFPICILNFFQLYLLLRNGRLKNLKASAVWKIAFRESVGILSKYCDYLINRLYDLVDCKNRSVAVPSVTFSCHIFVNNFLISQIHRLFWKKLGSNFQKNQCCMHFFCRCASCFLLVSELHKAIFNFPKLIDPSCCRLVSQTLLRCFFSWDLFDVTPFSTELYQSNDEHWKSHLLSWKIFKRW